MLCGVVDIGSNTVRLNVYRYENNNINIMFSKKETLGLVFYIKKGKLTNEGIKKLVAVLKEIKEDLKYFKIKNYRFFSTASLRNIENRGEVIEIIEDQVAIEIDVLSGEEEGTLSFCGSISTIKKDKGILIDVGGGSVEVVIFKDRKIKERHSIPVGSLKVYNKYVSGMIPNKEEINLIKKIMYSKLDKIGFNEAKIHFMCGVGGSIRAIGKMLVDFNLQEENYDLIDLKLLNNLKEELRHDNKITYNKILQVKPSRIHTLVPTIIIVESIASYFGCDQLQISEFSVREGYLFKKMLDRCQNV